jgi:hypothetical protein
MNNTPYILNLDNGLTVVKQTVYTVYNIYTKKQLTNGFKHKEAALHWIDVYKEGRKQK